MGAPKVSVESKEGFRVVFMEATIFAFQFKNKILLIPNLHLENQVIYGSC